MRRALWSRTIIFVLCCWLIWARLSFSLDPSKEIHHYREDFWQKEEGLPSSTVSSITQTADGYLWLGTYSGPVRFDGVRFTVFNASNTPALERETVYAMLAGREGDLWVGIYRAGVARLVDGEWSLYTTGDGLISDRVWALAEGVDGSLWVGTEVGLSRFHEHRWTSFTRRDGLVGDFVEALEVDSQGDVWIGTRTGLSRFTDGAFRTYTVREGLPFDHVVGLGDDGLGNLWIGTRGGALSRFDGSDFTTFTTEHGMPGGDVQALHADRHGNLWIGTYGGGVVRFSGKKLTRYTTDERFASRIVWALHEDRDGNLWIGTEGGGLARLQDAPVIAYDRRDGLTNERVSTVLEDRGGTLWIGTEGGGLDRLLNGDFISYSLGEGVQDQLVNALFEHSDGSLWIGTDRGWSRMQNARAVAADTEALGITHLPSVYAFEEDWLGRLWIGTYAEGLLRLDGDQVSIYTIHNGLPDNTVQVLFEDRDQGLWIGTDNGLTRFVEGEGFTEILQGVSVTTLHEDADGTLWIGTWHQGLYRHREGEVMTFTTEVGLPTNAVFQILEDDDQQLWMSGDRGIVRASKQELDDVALGNLDSLRPTIFDRSDGMKAYECVGGSQPAGYRTRDGRLWFATIHGPVSIDPGESSLALKPPHPVIEQVVVDDVPLPANALVDGSLRRLPPGRGELEVRYTGLSFRDPKRISFRYRLDGYSPQWTDAGVRRTAYFTNLDPGSYRFEVQTANEDGVWSATTAEVELYLAPRFYQQPWFLAAGIVLALVGGWVVDRGRRRLLVQRNEALEAEVLRRTADLEQEFNARLRIEDDLRRSETMLRAIIELATDVVFLKDEAGRYVLINPAGADAFGLQPAEVEGKTDHDLLVPEDADEATAHDREVREVGEPLTYEATRQFSSGVRTFETTMIPFAGKEGHEGWLLGLSRDVTEKRTAEERLKASLREKESLLREVHHRVKNNLQVIVSLLNLQIRSSSSADALAPLEESRDRVRSMALVHEFIYRSEDLARISVQHYFQRLATSLLWSHVRQPDTVALQVEADDVHLDIDVAVPCALIVNELLSNISKHAFPDNRPGRVLIRLQPVDDETLELEVSDDGVGLPEDFAARDGDTLGLVLVGQLADQLLGTLVVSGKEGVTVRVRFPSRVGAIAGESSDVGG